MTRVPFNGITITFIGLEEAGLCHLPVPSKSEYGIDTLILRYVMALHKMDGFVKSLRQGQRYDQTGRSWYVQTWDVDDNKCWPVVTVICKGFAEGTTPKPMPVNSGIIQNITVEATGLSISTTSGGEAGTITSASRNINYRAQQTSWRYITESPDLEGKIRRVDKGVAPKTLSSVIVAEGELDSPNEGSFTQTYNGQNAPGGLVAATTPAVVDQVLDVNVTPIWGSKWYDVEEIVARMYFAG